MWLYTTFKGIQILKHIWVYILDLLADTIWLYSDKNPHKDNVVYILKDWFEINYNKLAKWKGIWSNT